MKVKLKTLTKGKAIKALTGLSNKDILNRLRVFRQRSSAYEFELMKFVCVYEMSEMWLGMGRHRASGQYTGFEMFLQDHKSWMISITQYRRFKEAVKELDEDIIKKIGLCAVQHAWRVEDKRKRTEVIKKMEKEAEANNAPLSDAQARFMVKGKTPRNKTRSVTNEELRQENARLRERARTLKEKADLVEAAEAKIAHLEKLLLERNACITKLNTHIAKFKKTNAALREELRYLSKPTAKSQKKIRAPTKPERNRSRRAA